MSPNPMAGSTRRRWKASSAPTTSITLLYITGIREVESRSIQGVSLIKLTFHAGTDMGQAMAETVGYVNRARAFMPPGTVAPFVMRFDAGSVPVGRLVFASTSRTLGEIQDLSVKSRLIMRPPMKQLGVGGVPLLHGLHGGFALEH